MPVLGLGDNGCQAFTSGILGRIANDPEISTVVLVSIWRQVFEGDFLLGPGQTPARGDDRYRLFKDRFSQTVQRLRTSGKNVIVWEALPPAKRAVPKALAWGRILNHPADISVASSEHQQTFRFLSEAIAENRAAIRATVSPAAIMCKDERCAFGDNGIPLYSDNNHPSVSAAPYFAKLIAAQLDQQLGASLH
jgi:hypothetical protein